MKRIVLMLIPVVLLGSILNTAAALDKSIEIVVSLKKDLPKEFRSIIGFQVEIHHSNTLVFEDEKKDLHFTPANWLVAVNSVTYSHCQKLRENNFTGFPFDPEEGMDALVVVAIAPNPGLTQYLKPGERIVSLRLEIDNKHRRPEIVLRWASVCFNNLALTTLDFENPLEILEMTDDVEDFFPLRLTAVSPQKGLVSTWASAKKP